MRAMALVGLVLGSLIGIDPWGWDEVGPFRFLLVATCGLALVALADGAIASSWSTRLWGVLLVWLAVASFAGVDRFHAWVGTPDRHFGWLTWMVAGGLFMVGRQLSAPRERRIVETAIVVGAIGLGAVAVAEAAGWSFTEGEFAGDRLGGAFAQPALHGAAALLVVPIAGGVAIAPDRVQLHRLAAALGVVAGLFALSGSQARAAWLGFGLVVVVLVVARRNVLVDAWRAAPNAARASGVAVGLAAVVTVSLAAPVWARARSLFDRDGVMAGRLDEWQVGWRALVDRPITGWGPEGYRVAFGRHVDVDYVIEHGRDVITDRAHSGPLDVALVGGVPAGVIYVALLAVVGRGLWRRVRTGDAVTVGLALGAMGYFAQQLVLFPLAELDPLAWLIVGLALGPAPSTVRTWSVAPTVRGAAGALAVMALVAGGLDVIADHRVRAALDAGSPGDALDAADSARGLRPDSIRYDFIASRLAASGGDDSSLQSSLDRLGDGLRVSPSDPALRGEQGRRELDLALRSSGPDGRQQAQVARSTLEQVVADDPHHPEHLNRLGIARSLADDPVGAERAFREAIRLAPDNPAPARNLETLLNSENSP